MMKALAPKQPTPALTTTGGDPKKSDQDAETNLVPADDKAQWRTPKPEWDREDYDFAYMHTLLSGTEEAVKAINDSYLATTEASLADNRASWEARKEYVRLIFSKGGSLTKLKEPAAGHPDSGAALCYLARAYSRYDEHENAALAYVAAAKVANGDKSRVLRLAPAAVAYWRAGGALQLIC